jgi:hypothetical protein
MLLAARMKNLFAIVCVTVTAVAPAAGQFRTLNDRMTVREFDSLDAWKCRAAWVREHVLASAGLLPLPERTPLSAVVFGETKHSDYVVSKVYFESLPGFLVTGNLYQPIGPGPFPAILSPHGHWTYGRLENTAVASIPGRAIGLARLGFVVFTYDMIGYNDSRQLTHDFGSRRASLWGLSLGGLQLWNSIRALDFLESLPQVRRDRIGVTGESGGGTQTFLLSAVDDRVAVAAPVNMISLHMQGGCLCENLPGLRLDTNNVEIAATIAPRPLLMISATGDWTNETMELEYPAMRRFYALFGAEDRVSAARFDAEHNYNRASREAMYAWMVRWLRDAPADTRPIEKPFRVDPLPDLLVFHDRMLPPNALPADALTERWIDAARRQLASTPPQTLGSALRHVLGMPPDLASAFRHTNTSAARATSARSVLLASSDAAVRAELKRAGISIHPVRFTPFDAEAAANVEHFETYNRTPASQRVAELVAALTQNPEATLVADGEAALAGLLAAAMVPRARAIVDVGQFDLSSDAAFLDHVYIPGLRRAGDFKTAAAMAGADVFVHNAGDRFSLSGLHAEQRRLTPAEIASMVRKTEETRR